MDEQARVSVCLREGRIEISGSESFVREQLDRFQELIGRGLSSLPDAPAPPFEKPPTLPMGQAGETTNPYPNVIAIEEDGIRILKSIPGKRKAEKTVNVALLYLLGMGLKGEDTANFADIRAVCIHHSCLDTTNFAKTMRGAKECFIVAGSGKSQTVKLTHPGQSKANELAADLNAK